MSCKYPLHPDFYDIEDGVDMTSTDESRRMVVMEVEEAKNGIGADGILVKEETRVIPGYRNEPISLRIFSPARVDWTLPCVVNFHGGAFFIPAMKHHVLLAMEYAQMANCRVIMVDYRLAGDHPYPVPVEDCYHAYVWILEHAGELKIDPSKIILCGDSAGGNLTAAVCLMLRDRFVHPPIRQMMFFPALDLRICTDSAIQFTDTPVFNATGNADMWKVYLRGERPEPLEYASPTMAKDLSGLPKAYVEAVEFDCLHDEDVSFAGALRDAGVETELVEIKGAFHGFDMYLRRAFTKKVVLRRIEYMRKAFKES